jgi:chemotaxis protein MotB
VSRQRAHRPNDRRIEEEEHVGMERWLLTYADMITLLLALFVVLYALSSLNHVKYAQFAKGLNTSFNNGTSQPSSARTDSTQKSSQTQQSSQAGQSVDTKRAVSLASLEKQLRAALAKAGLLQDVALSLGARGLVVGLVSSKTFYGNDSAALSSIGERIVDITGATVRSHPNLVNVDGYADNVPITGGPYSSNWELSSERAVVVVERLQDVARVDPTQLYAVGFGQYHPVVPNNSAANLAENRRVDIVISPSGVKATLP